MAANQTDRLDIAYDLDAIESQHNTVIDFYKKVVEEATRSSDAIRKLEFGMFDKKTLQQMQAASDEANKIISSQVENLDKLTAAKRQASDAKLLADAKKEIQSLKESNAELKKLEKQYQDLLKQKKKNAQDKEFKKALDEDGQALKELSSLIRDVDKDLKGMEKTIASEEKQVKKLTGEYNVMSSVHRRLKKEAQDIGAVFGIESKEFEEAAAAANNLGAKLVAIDAKLGDHRRNVGNYASAWNGLGNAVNQVARELPAFANSFGTGIMAISNNLPILADELKKARVANEQLTASGKASVPVWKQVVSSLMSWQTVMILVVSILAKYGNDIWKWLTNGNRAAKEAVMNNRDLKNSIEALTESYKELGKELSRQEKISLAWAKLFKKSDAEQIDIRLESLRNKLKLVGEELDALKKKEKSAQTIVDYDRNKDNVSEKRLEKDLAILDNIQGKIRDAQNRAAEYVDQMSELSIEKMIAEQQAAEDAQKEQDEQYKKMMEERRKKHAEWAKEEENDAKVQFEIQKALLMEQIDINQRVLDDSSSTDEERYKAINKIAELRAQLATETANFEIFSSEKTANEIKLIYTQLGITLRKISKETYDQELELSQEVIKREEQLAEEQEKRQMDNAARVIANTKKSEDIEKQLHDARVKRFEEWIRIATQGAAIYAKLQDDRDKRAMAQLDRERETVNAEEQRDRARLERTITDKAELEDKITQLESKADDKRRQIDENQKERDRQAANRNKALALVNITANMLVGVSKEISTKGVAGLATSAAIGLYATTLTAAIAALSVPAYADGTDNHPGGPAIVGEGKAAGGYVPERVDIPGKKSFIVDRPTFLPNLPKGSSVTPIPDALDGRGGMVESANVAMLMAGGDMKLTEYYLSKMYKRMQRQGSSSTRVEDGVSYTQVKRGNNRHGFLGKSIYE